METGRIQGPWGFRSLSKVVLCTISGALTVCFAIAGALTGAIAGALAAKATKSGLLRGVSLGAIAGSILSVEVLEASRAYWCMEQTGSRGASSMADFIEELVRGRLVEESLTPAILTAYNLQVGIANTGYDEIHDVHGLVAPRGLSGDSLKRLPHHMISKDMKADNTCCAICLQDIEVGEIARSLPRCHHTFHLICVDKWLVKNDSCPVCRQNVQLVPWAI
ncbi:NEP1-interacting protein-like 2 isoform X2 [Glycine soja]|uniref:NEP1-interacting protein-like 2 isoform X2 n=1 Tax=Glycine max TaxID=3847 RepID=UPI0003DEA1D8|nr:NEP1-interacting protein-like 2 isoform X2 [Glycine max]XP_028231373.1 NEP1-interacting protein-like 2 isoform X2 [Glycine soja]|eukprot:XP_006579531.1 NEP1-interacting protein-like 2 isoform X2 [Glycine max]